MPTMEMILQFEKSSKWPNDLKAIQKMKSALAIRKLLTSTSMGDGTNDSGMADKAWLDVSALPVEEWAAQPRGDVVVN